MIIIMAYEKKNYGKWNGGYKKSEKLAYKPKRGDLKPLMTEEEKSSAKVEDLAYATALNVIEYLGQNGWVRHSSCARA